MLTIENIENLANWKITSDHGRHVTFDKLDIDNDNYTLTLRNGFIKGGFKIHILTICRHTTDIYLDNKKTGIRIDSLQLFLNSLGGTLFINIGFGVSKF